MAERQKRKEDLRAEKEEAWEKKLEEDRLEQEKREDLIRQIRALERAPKETVKVFDPTTSAGIGLLEEMSLVELKERLEMNKREQAKLELDKRQDILSNKADKETDLKSRIANIARIRGKREKNPLTPQCALNLHLLLPPSLPFSVSFPTSLSPSPGSRKHKGKARCAGQAAEGRGRYSSGSGRAQEVECDKASRDHREQQGQEGRASKCTRAILPSLFSLCVCLSLLLPLSLSLLLCVSPL